MCGSTIVLDLTHTPIIWEEEERRGASLWVAWRPIFFISAEINAEAQRTQRGKEKMGINGGMI
jgi:hypothetical protein